MHANCYLVMLSLLIRKARIMVTKDWEFLRICSRYIGRFLAEKIIALKATRPKQLRMNSVRPQPLGKSLTGPRPFMRRISALSRKVKALRMRQKSKTLRL